MSRSIKWIAIRELSSDKLIYLFIFYTLIEVKQCFRKKLCVLSGLLMFAKKNHFQT